jgi:hypothetical protein
MEIGESIKYPTTDDSWITKVIIGGILGLIPIVNFVVAGYYLKVIKETIEGKSGMPAWEDWGSLFIKGIVLIVIYILYMIIPIIILAVTVGGSIATIASQDPNAAIGALGGAFAGLSVSVILILIISLILPMAMAIYAKEDSFGAAFRIGEILSRIKSVIGGYVLAFIVILVLSMILGMVSIIPILGWIILIFGNFYIAAVGAYMFGKLYTESSA